jgi:hypothetical protein
MGVVVLEESRIQLSFPTNLLIKISITKAFQLASAEPGLPITPS